MSIGVLKRIAQAWLGPLPVWSFRYQSKLPFGNEYVISGTCSFRYTY
ncbi:hypothetical protein SynBIOSU31_02703 [Synechococcus sp. BIOS-U3-1]|nr:hypothetical protein SynBIOSU31_02703 [Synechococcus sp. BIOS-U3-1]